MSPKTVRLRHRVVELRTGPFGSALSADEYVDDGVPLVNPSDLRGGRILSEDAVKVSEAVADRMALYRVREGDLVLGRRGELGRYGLVGSAEAGFLCGTGSLLVRPGFDLVAKYFGYYLETTDARDWLSLQSVGSTMENLSEAILSRLPVPDLPSSWQQRIANFLDEQTARIDALIAEKQKLLVSTREYFTARLGTAVVLGLRTNRKFVAAESKGFESVPKEWGLIPLKHLATSSGGMTPSKDREDYWIGDIPWVSPKDMKRFVLSDSTDHISEDALAGTSLKLNPIDSVLVVVRGMILAHTFPVALNAVPVTINQDMKALRANSRVSAKYLAWMLRGLQPLMLSLTEESAHGTKALRTDQWANQCVPVPPTDEQESLVAAFETWEAESASLAMHLEMHIERLKEYRSSLISAAVTGQIDIEHYK